MDTYDPALFLDMKLALQELILKKLPTFDPTREAKYLTYLHYFIYDTFKAFRMNQESWQVQSLDIYKDIRRIAAIYNANGQEQNKTIKIFCEETGLKPETAKRYLQEAIGIRARQTEKIIDWDENEQAIMEDVIPDGKGSLNHIVWNHWKGKVIRDAMEKLSWREQTILKARNAICSNCGGMMPKKEQFRFQEIGKRIMNGASEKGAEVAYHAALDRLAAQLIEDGSCCIVDISLENLEQAENKNAAATYLYQVDCDGEWGEIRFDFENKKIKIQRLALITQHNIKPPSKRSFFFLWNIKPLCHPKSAGYYDPEKLTETTSGLRTANKFAIYKKGDSATSLLLSYDVQTNNNLVDYPMETVFCPNQFCSTVLQRTTIRFCPPLVQVNSVRGWSEGSASPSVLCR